MSSSSLLWRWVGVAATVIVLGAVALVVRMSGRNRLRFEYATGGLSADAYAALTAHSGWKQWTAAVGDGVMLNGLVRRPVAPDAPWILFFPGNDATQLATGQRVIEQIIGTEDWGAAVISYRGFDGSGGVPDVETLRRDGNAILASLLASEQLNPKRVHLVAFSIGGHVASFVAAEQGRRGLPLASLSLLASVDDIVMLRHSPFVRFAAGDAYQTRPLLRDIPAPVLVVQGANDEALDGPGQGRAIAAALGKRAEYIELPGVGHAALLSNEIALMRVHNFIAARQLR